MTGDDPLDDEDEADALVQLSHGNPERAWQAMIGWFEDVEPEVLAAERLRGMGHVFAGTRIGPFREIGPGGWGPGGRETGGRR